MRGWISTTVERRERVILYLLICTLALMLLKIKYTAYALLFFISLKAQVNLVPNPSFEYYTQCPYNTNQLYFSPPWYSCSTSPDYFNSCAEFTFVGIPQNCGGIQNAHTGDAYAGFSPYDAWFDTREMISVKLLDTLEAGKSYRVEFFISPASKFRYANNNFGVFFSSDSINFIDYQYTVIPQVNYSLVVDDTTQWTRITGIYAAVGGERFIAIGNFYNNANTIAHIINDTIPHPYSYYYIDDVSIVETKVPSDNSNILLYPNPTKDVLNISLFNLDTGFKILQVYNALGELIMSTNINSDTHTINTASLASGVFTIAVLDNKKYLAKKKFVVIN